MDGEKGYKLIQPVDPTKIKVSIRNKFAKLTLSSNKKKVAEPECDVEDQNISQYDLEKHKSVSRKLFEAPYEKLDESSISAESEVPATAKYVNPILRTSSSSRSIEDDFDETYLEPAHVEAILNAGGRKQTNAAMEDEVEALSHRISSIAMNAQEPGRSREEIISEEIKESQFNIVGTNESIVVSSAGEDEDSEEEESIITISDSSTCGEPKEATFNFELATSTIPATGETANMMLPCTLSNDKADRIEAFLRDVYKQQDDDTETENVPMTKAQQLAAADTEPLSDDVEQLHSNVVPVPKKPVLTTDDTVPMNQNESFSLTNTNRDTINSVAVKLIKDDNAKQWTQDETQENTRMSYEADITCTSDEVEEDDELQQSNIPEESVYISETASEFEESVILNDDEKDIVAEKEKSGTESSLEKQSGTVCNAASGTESSANKESEANIAGGIDTEHASAADNELVPSEEIMHETEEDSSYEQSEVRMNVGQISISTKININIQISQQLSSDELSTSSSESDNDPDDIDDDCGDNDNNNNNSSNELNADDNDDDDDDNAKNNHSNLDGVSSEENHHSDFIAQQVDHAAKPNSTALKKATVEETQNDTRDSPSKDCHSASDTSESSIEIIEDSPEQKKFFNGAADFLTAVYGTAWKTPEVLRSLKKNSAKVVQKQRQATVAPTKMDDILTKAATKHPPEESLLDDFSIFRQDIVLTNLDSTRLVPPKSKKILQIHSEPRKKEAAKPPSDNLKNPFKHPQSAFKERAKPTMRAANERWRNIVDSESEGDNASDDDEISSDASWKADSSDSDESPVANSKGNKSKSRNKSKQKDDLVYLDLTKDEIEVVHDISASPPANHDEQFRERLQDILRTCKPPEKPKLDATPNKPRRKLFTKTYGDELLLSTPPEAATEERTPTNDDNLEFNVPVLPWFSAVDKRLEAIRTGNAPFTPTTTTPRTPKSPRTASKKETPKSKGKFIQDKIYQGEINCKFSFLASLDATVGKPFCDPEALNYRENYRQKKEELATKLYDIYNEKLFDKRLNVPLKWNKKLLSTAGRCMNKRRLGERTSYVELSEKVLTSADRLRCTLIHELCHAATWIFNGEGGHGSTWKRWAHKANTVFPELPKIGTCHQYDIEYKYTYRCTLCGAKSYAHSKSKKVENIRCAFCHGAIEVYLNKKDKEGNVMQTPVREPTGFAKFVKDNYKKYRLPNMKHTDVMKALGNEFAALKVANGAGNAS